MGTLRDLPAGTFTMGSDSAPDWTDGWRIHRVTLSAFRMGATPVTVGMWREYSDATGAKMPEAPEWGWIEDHPIVNVKWVDIMGWNGQGGFCTWASDLVGYRLTVPTESQWEYAARGCAEGIEYPWGDTYDDSKGWGSPVTHRASTAPVFRSTNIHRNCYGLSDMVGNVWEWCSDWYGAYPTQSVSDPLGASSGDSRCLRGGSWQYGDANGFRCAFRGWSLPENWRPDLGFRLAAGPT